VLTVELQKLDAKAAAMALVMSLYQLKISLPPSVSTRAEKESMESILQFWLDAIFRE